MKRKNEKVPEFDDIIFENRNKTYGAYSLRKQYKSTASLSILGGITFSAILVIALSLMTEKGKADPGPIVIAIAKLDPSVLKVVPPPLPKAPSNPVNILRNLKPEVVNDTNGLTSIPITDSLIAFGKNGNVTDSIGHDPGATTPDIPVEDNTIFTVVQEKPEFPGGDEALFKFIGDNIKYPAEAESNNIQGRVILKFVVNPDGSVDKIELLRSVDPLLDTEAVRVVKTLPKFRPGKQNGVPVHVWFILPVFFRIEN
jgi:periplasmic protein TonB